MTFAARDFSPRRGVSDEHIPQWICEERATKSGRKRPAALRVAPNLACGFVARRLQPHGRGCALLAPRHRPNWAQRTSSYLCLRPLSRIHAIETNPHPDPPFYEGRGELSVARSPGHRKGIRDRCVLPLLIGTDDCRGPFTAT